MFKKILISLIIVAVGIAGFTFYSRYNVEQKMDSIEIIAEWKASGYYGFQDIANDNNVQFEEITNNLKGMGVTSIAIHEKTLKGLEEEGYINSYYLKDIINDYYFIGNRSLIIKAVVEKYEGIDKNLWDNYMVILTREKNTADFILNSFSERINGATYDLLQVEDGYAVISSKRISNNLGLGFLESELQYVSGLGFKNIVARVQNYNNITEQEIINKIEQLKRYNIDTVVFAGNSVLGYVEDLEKGKEQTLLKFAANEFKKFGITVGLIEVPAEQSIEKIQKGITLFSKECGYQETKLFSPEMKNDKDTIYEQCTRAIVDRRSRMIYLKPMNVVNVEPVKNLETTYELIEKLQNRVLKLDFKLDDAKSLEYFMPTHKEKAVIFSGIILATVLLLNLIFKVKPFINIGMLVLGALGTIGILFSTTLYNLFGSLALKGMALLAAIIFSSIASYFMINQYKELSKEDKNIKLKDILLKTFLVFFMVAIISITGGIFISTLLGDSKYMLKLDVFSGVKLAFIAPIIIYLFMFIKKIGIYNVDDKNEISMRLQFKKLLNSSITVKYGLIVLLIISCFGFLLIRTGNNATGMLLPFEEQFRVFLEQNLDARPRTKDLITFPFIMIFVYVALKRYKGIAFLTMLLGTIGSINIINTFSHLRMTLDVAIMSTLYSLVFGAVVGTIAISACYLFNKYFYKLK